MMMMTRKYTFVARVCNYADTFNSMWHDLRLYTGWNTGLKTLITIFISPRLYRCPTPAHSMRTVFNCALQLLLLIYLLFAHFRNRDALHCSWRPFVTSEVLIQFFFFVCHLESAPAPAVEMDGESVALYAAIPVMGFVLLIILVTVAVLLRQQNALNAFGMLIYAN